MVYGGTIRPGSCQGLPQLDIVSAFQSYGLYLAHGKSPQAESIRYNTVRHACPGPGACGGVRPPSPPLSLSHPVFSRCIPQTPWPVLQKPSE